MARKATLTMSSTTQGRVLRFWLFLVFFYEFSTVQPAAAAAAAAAENIRFDFSSFTIRNFTLLGDSHLRDGVVGLTRELGVPSSSSGSVICNLPISFFDTETNISASFSTRFSFVITNVNPSSFGDGLVFFLSDDNQTLGSPGGFLGLVNASQLTKNRYVAVEFDTRLDPQFNDPSNNHIGLDIDSLNSVKAADPTSRGIDLKSGNWITAWIDYKDDQKKLNVWMNYSSSKPEEPVLSVDIDLSNYLAETMYAGFSGSTEGSTELHLIKEWTFQTLGFQPVKPPSRPHNVSDNSVLPVISVSNSSNKTQRNLRLGLGVAGPAFFFIVLLVFCWIIVRNWNIGINASLKQKLLKGPREFSYKEIKAATKEFSSSRVLGHGAFGTVYKAFLNGSGTISAVKRSKHCHEGLTEFRSELSIIACLRHKNLVQLQGWCAEKGELLLVYEFMPNGSLDEVLYQKTDEGVLLNWSQRYNIAMGIASVLTYLHQECEQQVIHRDIKTSNILLDGNFNPRLGDFGLAKLMDHDKSPVSTLTAGTMGYLAPEYLQYGKANEKTDVFSFGVVILEVACGRRPIEKDANNNNNMVNLVDWVWSLHSKDNLNEAADKRLNNEFKEEAMSKLLLLGLSCANPDCNERPSMRRVLQILNGEAELPLVPKMKPSLTFSYSLPLSLDEIGFESEESNTSSP
ncbi:probable L-type lectin-domain containing receptor kinase S.7 [Macadamia integrifolia]|uniref:probable L-type lectin-domain containing receptor kinase S.7 n=1 Tax=Macadamia integrifolia TaxID=60698 RepID=UPI001C52D0C2|nr:probable L-type lectin-domain containing receptor kinase S.7 [Macadamia integrifolia]